MSRNVTQVFKKEPVLTTPDESINLQYISPEQTGRLSRETDYKSDFYALGCIFYELLTGRPVFAYTDVVTYIYALIATVPPAPLTLNAAIPSSLNAIVRKLIAKNPDERYQTAAGILADLEQCLRPEHPFTLAIKDVPPRLTVSDKLIGRDEELQRIKNAAFLAATGNKQVIYIRGYSGIGKTRLVVEFQHGVFSANHRMVAAKFDVLQKDSPYSALNTAVKELVRLLLTEDETQLAYWKERLLRFLKNNGQIIINQAPELKLIIGEQPGVTNCPLKKRKAGFFKPVSILYRRLQPMNRCLLFLSTICNGPTSPPSS